MGHPAIAAGFSLIKFPYASLSALDVASDYDFTLSASPMKIFSALYARIIEPSKLNRRKCALGIFRNVKCFALCVKDSRLASAHQDSLKKSGPRRISAGPLHALRRSHSLPINLVFYKAPYYLAIWEASSQGGLHA